ncbi:MAG: hypothetical protein Q4G43_13745 [Mobilicoccus sp.]|nr:hypothetical protein [Mobilicoccus sp.]
MRTVAAAALALACAAGLIPTSAPAAQATAVPCSLTVAALGPTTSAIHTVGVSTRPTQSRVEGSPLGSFVTSDVVAAGGAESLMNGGIIASDQYFLITAHRGGRVYSRWSTWHSESGTRTGSQLLARGLPPLRSLVTGGGTTFYTLDGGTLRRFTTSSAGARQAGTRTGFSIYRGLTLLRALPDRDVLAATTTRGALMVIEVPHTATFAPRHAVLRASGWGNVDRLAAGACGNDVALVAVTAGTDTARLFRVAPLQRRAADTPVRELGTLPHRVAGPIVTPVSTGW